MDLAYSLRLDAGGDHAHRSSGAPRVSKSPERDGARAVRSTQRARRPGALPEGGGGAAPPPRAPRPPPPFPLSLSPAAASSPPIVAPAEVPLQHRREGDGGGAGRAPSLSS